MSDKPQPPHRAVRLDLRLEAYSREDLANALLSLLHQLETEGLSEQSTSGGCSSGWIYHYTENNGPSHDEYVESLNLYLKAMREQQ